LKGVPEQAVYQLKKEVLGELETFSEAGLIELYYGDESGAGLRAVRAIWLAVFR
jgi:hypothetical protein